jgi:cyclopropane fatty-acyl-phospholipid synthase-like methyltransferase
MSEKNFDQARFEALQAKVVGDVAGAIGVLMGYIGDQSGVYRVLEKAGPCTHEELSDKAGIDSRYLREWLSANSAAGYVDYNAANDTFSLSPEQAALFAHEGEVTCMQGSFEATVAQIAGYDTAVDVFRTGRGRPWDEHLSCFFCGGDRFFRPEYMANLLDSWIPALDGVEAKLKSGARVADIGCGQGTASILMAKDFPNSTFFGIDLHAPSLEEAKAKADQAGVQNIEFQLATAKQYSEVDLDLVCVFDALHDMGDPVGAAAHIKQSLKPDGTLMLVEALAPDSLRAGSDLSTAISYAFSTVVCVPCSRSQEVGLALGSQAGERRLTDVLKEAGFDKVVRAAETAANMVLEARAGHA